MLGIDDGTGNSVKEKVNKVGKVTLLQAKYRQQKE
jgi:hypothetical protein